MKRKLIVLCAFILLIFVSCGPSAEEIAKAQRAQAEAAEKAANNITNQEAKELIIKVLNLPQKFRQDVNGYGSDFASGAASVCHKLKENGFITCDYQGYSLQVTEAGKPYLIGERQQDYIGTVLEFKTFDIDFNEITGIAINNEQKTATIRFSLKATNVTPIGRALENNIDNPRNSELVFKKFDNGWQLASDQNKASVQLVKEIFWPRQRRH